MTDSEIIAILMNMFSDGRFVRHPNSRWIHDATIAGEKLSAVAATHNQSFANFTLNCEETNRLKDAKESDLIHHAWVVKTKYDPETHKRKVVEAIELSQILEELRGVEPREGSYGAFWTLAASDDDAW